MGACIFTNAKEDLRDERAGAVRGKKSEIRENFVVLDFFFVLIGASCVGDSSAERARENAREERKHKRK